MEAQDLAFSEQGETSLPVLLERLFAPYSADSEAVVIDPGPAVELRSATIMSLSLVLHELATNAAKYGALSVPGGRVRISWQREDANSRLRIRWTESGGPPVTPPAKAGYGTQLIRSTITYNLHGQVEQNYATGGLETEIVIPLGSAATADQ